MRKKFTLLEHFSGSHELGNPDKKAPALGSLENIKKFIEYFDTKQHPVYGCYIDFNELERVPFSFAYRNCKYTPKRCVINGPSFIKGSKDPHSATPLFEICIQAYDPKIPHSEIRMGGPFDEGIEGYIEMDNTDINLFNKIEDDIKGYFGSKK